MESKSANLEKTFEKLSLSAVKKADRTVGIAYDSFMLKHTNFKRTHVERPERIQAIHDNFEKKGYYARCK